MDRISEQLEFTIARREQDCVVGHFEAQVQGRRSAVYFFEVCKEFPQVIVLEKRGLIRRGLWKEPSSRTS